MLSLKKNSLGFHGRLDPYSMPTLPYWFATKLSVPLLRWDRVAGVGNGVLLITGVRDPPNVLLSAAKVRFSFR